MNIMEGFYIFFNIDYVIVDMVIFVFFGVDFWFGSVFMDILLFDFVIWGNIVGNFVMYDIGQLWVVWNVFRGFEVELEFGLIGWVDGFGVVCIGDRYNVCEDFNLVLSCFFLLSVYEIGYFWNGLYSFVIENVIIMFVFIVCVAIEFIVDNINNI